MGNRRSTPLVWLGTTLRQLEKSSRTRAFDPAREAAFDQYHASAVYGQARFGLTLGLLTWVAFAVWDVMGFPSRFGPLMAIRLLLVAPVLVWVCWSLAARPEGCKPHLQRYLIVGPAAASAGLLLMMRAAFPADSAQAFQLYWPAFSALYFFLYALLGLRFKPAAVVGNTTFVSVLMLGLESGVEVHILGAALLQLGILNFTGMIVCARGEIHLRASFRARQHDLRQLETARRERANAQQARDEAMGQRRRAEAAMALVEAERAKLAVITEEKERFFSAAYHDLQQPLSIIGLYVHLAKAKLAAAQFPAIASDLSVIERAGHEIGLMFKGVRETWEIGQIEPLLETVDVAAVFAEIERELKQRAERKGLRFRVRRCEAPLFAFTDRNLFKRALSNLAGNAIKYTERGGVVLRALPGDARIRIDVCDSGIGIPTEYGLKIFDPYFQVAKPGRNRRLGLGLGLTIVRQIEQLLPEHRLLWHSRLGRGSRFSLEVPPAPIVAIPAPMGSDSLNAAQTAVLRGKYVLIVEDDAAILGALVEALQGAGCTAEGADSAAAARTLLAGRDRCPDLLITDYRLEHGATGLDAVDALRGRFEWAGSTPTLFITGELLAGTALSQLEASHDVYPKPIEPEGLLRKVAALLAPALPDSGCSRPQFVASDADGHGEHTARPVVGDPAMLPRPPFDYLPTLCQHKPLTDPTASTPCPNRAKSNG